jgi:sarcosine oxidase subunit gamma
MYNLKSALDGVVFNGFSKVSEAPLQGMVTLRADLSDPAVQRALTSLAQTAMPCVRGIEMSVDPASQGRALAWMSPDEVLVLLPYAEVPQAIAELTAGLAGTHAMAVNVSDARAMFTVNGSAARDVLGKVCPVDFAPEVFFQGQMRRTRAAQVAVAVWQTADDSFQVICFRSVAQYVFDVLCDAARPGGEVGYYAG